MGLDEQQKSGLYHNLNDRRQFVYLGNVRSDPQQIQCGVPQGSVLGPLLFLLYFNNDFQNSSDLLDFHIFADAQVCFAQIKVCSNLNQLLTINSKIFIIGYVQISCH